MRDDVALRSCLYEGWVRHRRLEPFEHAFRYRVFMVCLDLDELDVVFRGSRTWSTSRPAVAWFRRSDHLGDPTRPLSDCVRELVQAETGTRPKGPIRLLTNLRYLGHVMNPISLFYCFDERGDAVEAVVAEVHNTPWNERHCYVLPDPVHRPDREHPRSEKSFHVSPFMPMNQSYRWTLTRPGESVAVRIESFQDAQPVFDASMSLRRRRITSAERLRCLLAYPLMTVRVVAAIYWQALLLWWRGATYFPHPRTKLNDSNEFAGDDSPELASNGAIGVAGVDESTTIRP